MVRTAVAATDPDEPDRPMSVPRADHLAVVPDAGEPGAGSGLGPNVLSGADIERLSVAARHRVAAFVHTRLADLEELGDPELPEQPGELR
ncbi:MULTISPECIES: hypothetical protein [unclassified Nocardia]|uniref:hypothetical protein n=1 Tax=unclassified Nocardia TaxID=2637762 RepID=UPI001CE48F35|nr:MULTISPECIES: hypothetical protein [unclassified Nocardia]